MISCDANILFPALEIHSVGHVRARAFLAGHQQNSHFGLCELVLMEVYVLIRNPAICRKPLDARDALHVIETLRQNPKWMLMDYPGGLMGSVWSHAGKTGFPRRRIFDTRLAVTLRHHGVTEFATANGNDFVGFGFERVWNPLGSDTN